MTFPEILVVWSLRQYLHGDADIGRVLPQFTRAFGIPRLRRAIDAFVALTGALSSYEDLSRRIGAIDDPRLTSGEATILIVLTAFQRRNCQRARRIIGWHVAGRGQSDYARSAAAFAILMGEAGHALPGAAPPIAADQHAVTSSPFALPSPTIH